MCKFLWCWSFKFCHLHETKQLLFLSNCSKIYLEYTGNSCLPIVFIFMKYSAEHLLAHYKCKQTNLKHLQSGKLCQMDISKILGIKVGNRLQLPHTAGGRRGADGAWRFQVWLYRKDKRGSSPWTRVVPFMGERAAAVLRTSRVYWRHFFLSVFFIKPSPALLWLHLSIIK